MLDEIRPAIARRRATALSLGSVSDFDHSDIAYVPTIGVRRYVETPVLKASDDSLKGYGCIVNRPRNSQIEIVRWPAQGRRPVDKKELAAARAKGLKPTRDCKMEADELAQQPPPPP